MWVKAKLLKCAPADCFSAMRARPCPPYKNNKSVRNEKGPGLEAKCVSQLFLGSKPGTCRSAIGQFFLLSLVTVPEVFLFL